MSGLQNLSQGEESVWFYISSHSHWISSLLNGFQMEARDLAPETLSEEHFLTLEVTEFH